jgi:hypothetical protein
MHVMAPNAIAGEQIVDAIKTHLGALQSITAWALLLALAAGWAGLKGEAIVEVGPLKFPRRQAYHAVAGAYTLASLATLALVARLHGLLRLLGNDHFVSGYSALATHSWLMNPFGYLGTTPLAQASCAASIGLLIFSWWLCVASVVLIRPEGTKRFYVVALPLAFLVIGNGTLYVLWQTYGFTRWRLLDVAPALATGLADSAGGRWLGIWIGTVAGLAAFVVAVRISMKRSETASGAASRDSASTPLVT